MQFFRPCRSRMSVSLPRCACRPNGCSLFFRHPKYALGRLRNHTCCRGRCCSCWASWSCQAWPRVHVLKQHMSRRLTVKYFIQSLTCCMYVAIPPTDRFSSLVPNSLSISTYARLRQSSEAVNAFGSRFDRAQVGARKRVHVGGEPLLLLRLPTCVSR